MDQVQFEQQLTKLEHQFVQWTRAATMLAEAVDLREHGQHEAAQRRLAEAQLELVRIQ